MPRLARIVLPHHPHHITQRGVRSINVFHCDEDRLEYLRLLAEQGKKYKLKFLSYCLMPNHVHLIAVPEDTRSLARAVGEAHRLYTRKINFRERTRGHLFQSRFFSAPLDEHYFIAAMRYVARNPVRAGFVEQPWQYKWSSAAFHVGSCKADLILQERDFFGLEINWMELFQYEPAETPALRRNTREGKPCGGAELTKKVKSPPHETGT